MLADSFFVVEKFEQQSPQEERKPNQGVANGKEAKKKKEKWKRKTKHNQKPNGKWQNKKPLAER